LRDAHSSFFSRTGALRVQISAGQPEADETDFMMDIVPSVQSRLPGMLAPARTSAVCGLRPARPIGHGSSLMERVRGLFTLQLMFRLQMCLKEPQPFVDTARDFGEQIGRVQVAQVICIIDGLPDCFAEHR